jgi:hypothetical protein
MGFVWCFSRGILQISGVILSRRSFRRRWTTGFSQVVRRFGVQGNLLETTWSRVSMKSQSYVKKLFDNQ